MSIHKIFAKCLILAVYFLPSSVSFSQTALTETAGKTHFFVSAFNLGTVDQIPPTAESVVDGLNTSGWCSAETRVSPSDWNVVPAGIDPRRWLSVVAVGFDKQAEAYIFQFDQPGGGVRLVAHFSHRKRPSNGAERWFQPTPQLLGVFQTEALRASTQSGVPLRLEIVEAPTADTQKEPGFDEALSLPPRTVLPPLKAIITAAACLEGWVPTAESAKHRARLEVRVQDRACSFRLAVQHDGQERVFARSRVPWEEFHEQLRVLFRLPRLRAGIADFTRLSPGATEVLESDGNRTFVQADGELIALDTNAQEVWRLRSHKGKLPPGPKARKPDHFLARRENSGKVRLFGWGTSLTEISPTDGAVTPLANEAPAGSTPSFDADTNGELALAREERVFLFSAGKEKWNVTETSAVLCGPLLEPDRVLLGNERGELVALAKADGKVLWRKEGGARFWGPIVACGDSRLAFSQAEETLFCFDPKNGEIHWKFATGDVLVQAPFLQAGSIVVASKRNHIWRLDPKNGAVQAEVQMQDWVLGVRPLPEEKEAHIAVNEASGRIILLGPKLNPTWETSIGTRLLGKLAVTQMRPQWTPSKKNSRGSSEEILEDLSAEAAGLRSYLFCSDSKGFLYKISHRELAP